MSEGVAQDPRMPTHPAQSWGVSILGHGVALWVALFVLGDLTFVPKEEPFRWDVSMVEPPPQPTAEPVPTLAEPVSVTAPQTPATSATEVVQTVQPFQRVETREVQRDIPQTRPVEQAVERTVSQPVTRPVETVVQAGPAAAKATPSPVIEATAIETASASVREVVRPNTTATVAPAPVVTTPQREAVAQASRAMASPAPLVRTSQPESVVQAGQALAKAAPTPVVESKAIETASAREVVASKVVSAPPAGPIDAPSQPAQEATVRQVPMRSGSAAKTDFRWVGNVLGERIRQLMHYPAKARLNNWEGRVMVKVVIREDGHLHYAEIVQGSGHALLDEDALDMIRRACPLKMEHALGRPHVTITVPVVYQLNG